MHTYIATYADTQENKGIGAEVETPVLVVGTPILILFILGACALAVLVLAVLYYIRLRLYSN